MYVHTCLKHRFLIATGSYPRLQEVPESIPANPLLLAQVFDAVVLEVIFSQEATVKILSGKRNETCVQLG